jgi:hypothetical protein
MAVEETLLSVAALAGRTLVAAAATDAWATTKRGLARLVGRGDAARAEVTERRLDDARQELLAAPAEQLMQVQDQVAAAWQIRLLDLLEDHPEMVTELRALVDQVRTNLPDGTPTAGPVVAAGGDVSITASGGGVAAGVIQGNVTMGNPTVPDPAY